MIQTSNKQMFPFRSKSDIQSETRKHIKDTFSLKILKEKGILFRGYQQTRKKKEKKKRPKSGVCCDGVLQAGLCCVLMLPPKKKKTKADRSATMPFLLNKHTHNGQFVPPDGDVKPKQ